MAQQIFKYIDGIPLYADTEEDNKLLANIFPNVFKETNTLNGTNTALPTMPSGFKYESPFGDKSVFNEDNNYWLGDKLKEEQVTEQSLPTVNKKATSETINLFNNLISIQEGGLTLFGHHDSLAYGRLNENEGWSASKSKGRTSDVYDVVIPKQLPALMGWDIGGLEKGNNLINEITIAQLKVWISKSYKDGLVNTVCWHISNPSKQSAEVNYWFDKSTPNVLSLIRTNAAVKAKFLNWLDKAALFFKDLIDDNGKPIPIIFRPLHEFNTDYPFFWWNCINHSNDQKKNNWNTIEDFVFVYKLIVDYLTKNKNINNLLFALSFQDNVTEKTIANFYSNTGLENYVDIIGVDSYQNLFDYPNDNWQMDEPFYKRNNKQIDLIIDACKKNNVFVKVAAITEIGSNDLLGKSELNNNIQPVLNTKWWTGILGKIINKKNIAYIQTWRNTFKNEYYDTEKKKVKTKYFLPFVYSNPNVDNKDNKLKKAIEANAADFNIFCQSEKMVLQNKLATSIKNIYSRDFKLRK